MAIDLPENLQYIRNSMNKPNVLVIPALRDDKGEISHVIFKVKINWKEGVDYPQIEYVTEDKFILSEAKANPSAVLLKMYRQVNRILEKKTTENQLQTLLNSEIDKEFV